MQFCSKNCQVVPSLCPVIQRHAHLCYSSCAPNALYVQQPWLFCQHSIKGLHRTRHIRRRHNAAFHRLAMTIVTFNKTTDEIMTYFTFLCRNWRLLHCSDARRAAAAISARLLYFCIMMSRICVAHNPAYILTILSVVEPRNKVRSECVYCYNQTILTCTVQASYTQKDMCAATGLNITVFFLECIRINVWQSFHQRSKYLEDKRDSF